MRNQFGILLGMVLLAAPAVQSDAAELSIIVTNDGNSSFSLTPVWFGFDDGSFDFFDPGAAASASLEALAEEGDTSGLVADFGAATQGVIVGSDGAAPVIEPGETASFTISLDTTQDRYFSYASMLIPSNDAFIGSAESLELFDPTGNFVGGGNSATYFINGDQIWDAGTEVNNTFGAAFSTQPAAGEADEFGTVALLAAGGLENFLGTGTPIGTITDLIGSNERLATITITSVPEPSSAFVIALATGLIVARRKRT